MTEIAPRASFETGRTNLFGKNRSVNLFSGVSLRPRDAPNDPAKDGQCCAFSEYRVYGTFTEPRILDGRVDGQVSLSVEQAIRNSFTFLREALGVQALRRLPGRTTAVRTAPVAPASITSFSWEGRQAASGVGFGATFSDAGRTALPRRHALHLDRAAGDRHPAGNDGFE